MFFISIETTVILYERIPTGPSQNQTVVNKLHISNHKLQTNYYVRLPAEALRCTGTEAMSLNKGF